MHRRAAVAAVPVAVLMLVSACGGADEPSDESTTPGGIAGEPDPDSAVLPSPTESEPAAPTTTIVLCALEDGLPVAEVKVDNTTEQAAAFVVEVQFSTGDTVLGTGMELTQELQPGQNQTIRMGSMQGDADAVDACEVTETSLTHE